MHPPRPDHPSASFPLAGPPHLWLIIALAGMLQGGVALVNQGLPILYPFIQEDLGLTRAQVGLITSAMMGAGIATVLVGGWLTDLFGVRRVAVAILGLTSVLFLGFLLAQSLWAILVLAAAVGMVQAPGYPASSRAIMDWVPRRTRALAMSIKQTGVPAGGLIAAATLPAIAVAAGWRMASATLAGYIFLAALYRDKPNSKPLVRAQVWGALRELTRERRLLLPTLWGAVFVGMQYIVGTYLILFLIENVHLSPILAGGYIGVAQIASIVGRVSWGATSDFLLGARRTIILGILGVLTTVGRLGAGFIGAETPAWLVVLVPIALGATVLSWHGVYTTLIVEIAGASRSGMAVGAVNTVMRAVVVTIPPLFGLLVDVSDSYRVAWSAAAALAFATTAALVLLSREPRHT